MVHGACSPGYVIRAGFEELKILRAREDIVEVFRSSELDEVAKGKLVLVLEARRFAEDALGVDVGGSYLSYVELDSDTLALVVTAAHRDRLAPKIWWFPIVGRVPYRGHFSAEAAERDRAGLEEEGYDAMIHPTAAFSTLGWFDDPVFSTTLHQDEVEVVATVLHELAHQHLYVAGRGDFNESFANFVGRVGAAAFFCGREGGGEDTVKCLRAKARWGDAKLFGEYLDGLRAELGQLYGDGALSRDEKIERREPIFRAALERFDAHLTPELESLTFASFRRGTLNNVTLLSYGRYYHRLSDFEALLAECDGHLREAIHFLRSGVSEADDPWEVLGGS